MLQATWSVRLAAFCLLASVAASVKSEEGEPASELFNRRILPIFQSAEPSSCVQCHLASVDLKNYILPSSEKTFLSLRDQELVDLEHPLKSKILTLIQMGEKDLDEGARLIHAKTRRAEYEAFAAWLESCCRDPRLRSLPPLAPEERARPARPDEVIRHARKSRVVDSFVRNVWSQRMRCFPCHTPHEIDETDPRRQAAVKTMKKFQAEYEPELIERMNIFRETPEATLDYLIEKSRTAPAGQPPLINLDEPRRSLLVLKPLSKLPGKDDQGKLKVPAPGDASVHMGGLKMHLDDQSYKSFVAWIQDYANVVGDRYKSVEDLPADNWRPSQQVLRLTDAPADWPAEAPVQLLLFARNQADSAWEPQPIAFTQGPVTPRRAVNGMLFLLDKQAPDAAAPTAGESAVLPAGKYLVKAYVDRNGRLDADPAALLGAEEFAGQTTLSFKRWREGFLRAQAISGASLEKE